MWMCRIYYYDENQNEQFREKLIQVGIDEQQIYPIPSTKNYDLPIIEQIL